MQATWLKNKQIQNQTNPSPAAAPHWMSTRGLCWRFYMTPTGAGDEPRLRVSPSILQYTQTARVLWDSPPLSFRWAENIQIHTDQIWREKKKSRNIPKSNWGIFFRHQLALQRSWPNKEMCCRPLYMVRIQVCSEKMKPTTAQWLCSKCHKIYMHILTTPYLKFQRLWFFIHLKTPLSAVLPSGV